MPTPKHKPVKPELSARDVLYEEMKRDRANAILKIQIQQARIYDSDEGAVRLALGRFITARGKLMAERIKAIPKIKGRDVMIAEEETLCARQIYAKIESQVEVIGRLSERRAKLLGLNAPDKVALTDPTGNDPLPGLTTAQVIEIAAAKHHANPSL